MRNRATIHLTTLAALLGAPSAAVQKVIKHDTEKVSVTLPAGWRMGKMKPKMAVLGKERKLHRIMSFVAAPPGSDRGVNIDVDVINNGAFNIRPDVLRDQILYQSHEGIDKCEISDKPMLHLVAHQTKPSKVVLAIAYRRGVGRTTRLAVRCAASQWEDIKPAFLEMAKTMSFDLAPWPSRPSGRTEKLSKGVLFSSAPEIKKPAMRDIRKCVLDIQKGMAEMHGEVARPKGDPLVVYVNELMADHKQIAASQKVAQVVMEPGHHRLFTVLLEKRGTRQRSEFVSAVCVGILTEIYGLSEALWFEVGERWVAEQRDMTKKRLPSISKNLAGHIPPASSFEELAAHKKVPSIDYARECLVYVGMFHAGPKQYRAAYKAFLADLKATGDARAATKKHLLSFDQGKMKADARAFEKKMRGVKVK